MRKRWQIVLAAALAVLAGCTTYVPEPDSLMAGGDEGRLGELQAGRRLYLAKCSGCHSVIPVDRFDSDRWTAEVAEMVKQKKVRLTVEDQALLLSYLTTANTRPR